VPEEICSRAPTTDTFSLPQGQDEFYYALPYPEMDLCLYAHNHGVPAADVAAVMGTTEEQVRAGVQGHRGQAPRHAAAAPHGAAHRARARDRTK
jgi:NH3-dependent NAD+ synthetase